MARIGNKGFYTDIDGLQATLDSLQQYEQNVQNGIKDVVKKSAQAIESDAERIVARDTGATQQSIEIRYFGDGLGASIGPRLPNGYKAHWIEFGTNQRMTKGRGRKRKVRRSTGQMPALPFMSPAFEGNKDDYVSDLTKVLSDV